MRKLVNQNCAWGQVQYGRPQYSRRVVRWVAPKNSRLANLRIELHNRLDAQWQFGSTTRAGAYARLAQLMGLPKTQCHIGMFDEAQCERALRLLAVK